MKKILLISLISFAALAANDIKQTAPVTFYNTVKLNSLSTAGVVTNTSAGQLGSVTKIPISNGGTNSNAALNNNRFIVSSGGTIGEAAVLTANSIVGTDANGLPTTLTSPLSIAKGGTNSGAALNGNRVIVSSATTVGELAVGTSGQILQSNGTGSAPTWVTNAPAATNVTGTLAVAHGGTNSAAALNGFRVIVSSASTLGELAVGSAGQVLQSNGTGVAPTWVAASAGTKYAWSGFHNSTYQWLDTASGSFQDFTNTAVGTLTQKININFGSVTTAASTKAGITWTPAASGITYLIHANVSFECATTNKVGTIRLWDGTTVIATGVSGQGGSSAQLINTVPLTGLYTSSSTSAVTFTLQENSISGCTPAILAINSENVIEWTITSL